MTAQVFLLPFRPAFNPNGLVVPGAKLYFYLTGTTTPQAVYADSGLVTPLANPVVANSAGVWPAIYLDSTKTYRVVLKDQNGASLSGDLDPYYPDDATALGQISASVGIAAGYATSAGTSATTATTQAGISTTQATASAASATLASGYATAAGLAAGAANVLPSAPAALPYEVTAISGGVGSGSGGTNGTYAGGVSGGPAGFQWTYTIAAGALASYAILNPGLSTSSSAPTLSLPSGGLTGATVPTATVGTIPVSRTFWGVSSDSVYETLWQNSTGSLAAVNGPDGNQIKRQIGAGSAYSEPTANTFVPLFADDAGNVAVWLESGLLSAPGLGTSLLASIGSSLNFAGLTSVPSRGSKSLFTDGRSLTTWRRKRNKYKSGLTTTVMNVGLVGDSWTDYKPIPQAWETLLVADTAQASAGWIGFTGNNISGVTFSSANWTVYDMFTAGLSTPPTRGCGPDGMALYTTGTTATASVSVRCTDLNIYYWNGNGTFRYRVDGGSWTTVAGTSANAHAKVTISGLSDATHTFDIDTTGNTGTAEVHGFLPSRSGIGGVRVHKLGKLGSTGAHFTMIKTHLAYFATDLALDVAHIMLGTNDFNNSAGTSQLTTGIADIVTALAPAGVIVTHPPQCGGSGSIAQTVYRDAMLTQAQTNGWEFYNALDDWASYATENAAGAWDNSLHVTSSTTDNTGSAYRLAARPIANLLTL